MRISDWSSDVCSSDLSEDEADRARDVINGLQQGLAITSPADNRPRVVFTEAALRERTNAAMSQSAEVMRRRIDESGTREASSQRQGTDRIALHVPGLHDPQRPQPTPAACAVSELPFLPKTTQTRTHT